MTGANVGAPPEGSGADGGLEPRARRAMLVGACTAGLLIAQGVAARAVRDALFLSRFATTSLPLVMGAAALISIASGLVAGRFMVRHGPARCLPWLSGLNAVLFALEYLTAAAAPQQIAVALYLHVAALGGVLVSAFWSAVNERFDPYTAKRVMGRIGVGAALGGVVGGVTTARLAERLSITDLLVGIALTNLLAAACAMMLRDGSPAQPPPSEPAVSGAEVLRRTPYLRDLMLGRPARAERQLLDYVFKAEAVRS